MLNQGVCFIRLDFETFTLAGPAATGEENGGLCTDTFTATVREIMRILRRVKS